MAEPENSQLRRDRVNVAQVLTRHGTTCLVWSCRNRLGVAENVSAPDDRYSP